MLAVGLGHEMPAVLAVTAAFFAGIALGAWALDRRVSVTAHPGRWYAVLEMVIGVWGLATIALVPRLNESVGQWIGISPSFARQWAVAFGAPFALLLPATAAMGATLAAMDRLATPVSHAGRAIGGLYAANTAGAVVGVLVCTFVLLPVVGMRASLSALATINIISALVIFVISSPVKAHQPAQASATITTQPVKAMGIIIFITGLLGVGYEVLGVRMLAQIIENSIYSFAAVLAVYLMGTTMGAAWYQRFGSRYAGDRLLGTLFAMLAGACVVGVFILSTALPVYLRVRLRLGDSLEAVAGAEMAVACMVFLVPTALMGAIFSHLTQANKRSLGGVGSALALNTLGAAVAPLLFGVLLLPAVGARLSFTLLIVGYLTLSAALAVRRLRGLFSVLIVVLVTLLFLPNPHGVNVPEGGRMLHDEDGVMATVAVVEDAQGRRLLRVNNRFQMGGTSAARTELRQGHLPLLLHPHPHRALFLGLGTGITFRAAATYPRLVADGVELIPEVVRLIRYFDVDSYGVSWNDRRLNVYASDARRYVSATDQHYDVIVADFFHPGRDGAGSLYTREHFLAIRNRLAEGGLFCQWLPLYQLDDPTLKLIIRTYLDVFPHAQAFLMNFKIQLPGLALVAGVSPRRYPPDWYDRRVRDEPLRKHLTSLGIRDAYTLLGLYAASPKQLRDFAGTGPINTDNHPLVTFNAPRFTWKRGATSYGRLISLLDHHSADVWALIEPRHDASTIFGRDLTRFIHARDIYLHGLVDDVNGRQDRAIAAYVNSARISARFTPGYGQCLMLAVRMAHTRPDKAARVLEQLIEARPQRKEAAALLKRLLKP